MKISRRDFLKWIAASGVAVGVGKAGLTKAAEVIANLKYTPVIWLQAAGCSGCTISFLNMVQNNGNGVPTVDKLLTESISLKYHSTIMAPYGEEAMDFITTEPQVNSNNYILIVEGGIPTAQDGAYCIIGEKNDKPLTALQGVKDLAERAKHIIAIGTCSAFKGVSGMGANITEVKSVSEVLDSTQAAKVINLPGCPTHPYIIGKVILKLLAGETVQLDGATYRRPLEFYPAQNLHGNIQSGMPHCPLKPKDKATTLGVCERCLENMGCKGRDSQTRVSCYRQYWAADIVYGVKAAVWENPRGCLGAGNICIGCSSPNFPSFNGKGLYVK